MRIFRTGRSAMLAADGCEVKPESAMAKMSAQMGIAMKTMRDASSRNLAQMMIEGNHMGVTDLTMALKEAENCQTPALWRWPSACSMQRMFTQASFRSFCNGSTEHKKPRP